MGKAALSAFLEVLFDRVASPPVLDFFKDNNLDHRLLRELKMKLLAINKVLDDAEVKQITDKNVKLWLQELQDAVYESDDLLDAVNTEAMGSQLEKENQSSSTRNMDELPSTEAKLKEILQRLEDIIEEIHFLGLKEGVPVPEQTNKTWPKTSLLDEASVYGRDKDKESIVNQLLAENDSLDVITIKGMVGVGKTTLAQLVYNDETIVKKFEFRAWVYVSEEFDVFRVTKTILKKVTSSPSFTDDLDHMQEQLKNNLVGKKFLVVLDDVWNENRDHWDLLKKPLEWGHKGSKILVTTRNEGVAQIMRTVPTHSLKKLSDEHCWELFAKYAFEGGESQPHEDMREMDIEIVKKCGGLPLAAKALGGLLRDKKTKEEWSNIIESNVCDLEDKNCNMIPVLRVSYHYLPPRLKRCFAFASIFPKDYAFRKDELILLWAAQSFFPEGKNVHDIGGEYFNELLSRSFFQRLYDDLSVMHEFLSRSFFQRSDDDLFIMHDLMHDLATSVSGQSCRCCENPGVLQEITKTTRHMSYAKDSIKRFQTLPETNTLRTLAQLTDYVDVSPKLCPEEISDVLLTRFKRLRVLSLRDYDIEVLPETIGSLKHLRYFDLSKTQIKKLPNSICDLYNLQTLILTYCSDLIELPTHTCKLVNLHYLHITGCYELQEMPRNLGKLKNLVRLERFIVGEGSNGGNIRDLGPLLNLGGELSISSLQNVVSGADAAEARLKDKKCLEKLELSWDLEEDDPREKFEVLEKLQPHRSLKELTIKRYMGERIPNWIEDQMYSNMVSLELEDCKHCRSIPALGQLPSLKKLCITRFTNLETLDYEFYGNSYAAKPFGSIEDLSIKGMPKWKEWYHRDGEAFPLLREFHLEDCPKLTGNLPSHLPSLIKLKIDGCPDLAVSLPEAPALSDVDLRNSNEILLNHLPQGLKSLEILGFYHLTSLPPAAFSSTLKSLGINSCSKLELQMHQVFASLERLTISGSCDSLQSFPLQKFPRLVHLEIRKCSNLESFSSPDGTIHKLTRLTISECNKFLGRSDCGLPSSLTSLKIYGCDEFMDVLTIKGECKRVVSFPAKGFLPKSLTDLSIKGFDDLETLEHKGFEHLTSLSSLVVWKCRKLKCIPPEGLPASLTYLCIDECPLLEARLKRDVGEDWDKIAHIPYVTIGFSN